MDFVFNTVFQEIISLSIVLCLFIHNIGSKQERECITFTLTFMIDTPIYTRITSARDFGEFLGTFRYAAIEFYLKICFIDYSSYIKA